MTPLIVVLAYRVRHRVSKNGDTRINAANYCLFWHGLGTARIKRETVNLVLLIERKNFIFAEGTVLYDM